MYATVPSVVPGLVRCSGGSMVAWDDELDSAMSLSKVILASPKSKIFMWPRLVTKMFNDAALNYQA
jgi:hypothetical protein